jgi:photosystem II stability/assembly factor-like uncharacterized protein
VITGYSYIVKDILITRSGEKQIFVALYGGGVISGGKDGASWKEKNSGLKDDALNVNSMLQNGRTIFISTEAGIYRSEDNGDTWTSSSIGLTNLEVGPMASLDIETVIGDGILHILLAGTSGGGVYRSDDYGLTWNMANSGIMDMDIFCLFADPLNKGTVFAGTNGGGLYIGKIIP